MNQKKIIKTIKNIADNKLEAKHVEQEMKEINLFISQIDPNNLINQTPNGNEIIFTEQEVLNILFKYQDFLIKKTLNPLETLTTEELLDDQVFKKNFEDDKKNICLHCFYYQAGATIMTCIKCFNLEYRELIEKEKKQ